MTNAQKQLMEDQLYHTAVYAMEYVAHGKSLAKDNAERLGCSQFDVEVELRVACARLVGQLTDARNAKLRSKMKRMKGLMARMTALETKLDKQGDRR